MIFDISIWFRRRIRDVPGMSKMTSAYPDDVLCTCLCRKHAKDTRSTPNIENSFALEQMAVLHDRRAIGSSTDVVLQHLLVNAWRHRSTIQNKNKKRRIRKSHRNGHKNRHSYERRKIKEKTTSIRLLETRPKALNVRN